MAAGVVFGLLLAPTANAQSRDLPADQKRALTRHLTDLTDCVAYYSIALIGLRRGGEHSSAAKAEEVKRILLDRSFIVTGAIEMDPDTALARQRAAVKEQMALMDNDLANFAILTEKYGMFCKSVVEDPEARLDYWKRELRRGRRD